MFKSLSAALALAVLATPLLAAPAGAAPAPAGTTVGTRDAQPGFRVLPYLQNPKSDAMTVSWIGETAEPGILTVTGPGIGNGKGRGAGNQLKLVSVPEYLPLMEYTQKELGQSIAGSVKGSWLKANTNYKHTLTVKGLKAGKDYKYTVAQGGKLHEASFSTAPDAESWEDLRLIAFSDSETEPMGRTEHREWELNPANGYTTGSEQRPAAGSSWTQKFGSATRYGDFTLRYPLSQDTAMRQNMAAIEAADPDLMLIAGDLVQGAGYQPAWDEFFGYVAGEHGDMASKVPLLTAIGNWETYAGLNGGYGTPADPAPAVISRNKYLSYFENDGDAANPASKGSYYRTDHGPVTVLTLDSTNGEPDENTKTGTLSGEPFSGNDSNLTAANLSTDTQGEFTDADYAKAYTEVFEGTTAADSDLPNMSVGGQQWKWAEAQLADARKQGQIVIVQFHHAAYSSGVHGTPPNHEHADNQSGTAMRAYSPLFENHGVAAVISGHDEMFERSWIDEDGDGQGFHSYDVGVAADGLRGEQLVKNAEGVYEPLRYNTRSKWSAAANEPETWATDETGTPQLVDGGLHYGHLQIDIKRQGAGAEITLSPVYLFPVLDKDYNLVKTERRLYDDVVKIPVGADGTVKK